MPIETKLNSEILFSFPKRLAPSSWIEHTPFAMFVSEQMKPSLVVELGVHNGVSLCAFAQGAELTLNVACKHVGIDSFEGDIHVGMHGSYVYDDLLKYIEVNNFKNIEIIKSYFSDALYRFENHSIDVLHIDGRHDYDSVKNDYLTWLPKVKPGGLILFHDTCVRKEDFGVWQFFEELNYGSSSFNFEHGFGLGVVAIGEGKGQDLVNKLNKDKEQTKRIFSSVGSNAKSLLDEEGFQHFVFGLSDLKQHLDIIGNKRLSFSFNVPEAFIGTEMYIIPSSKSCMVKIDKIEFIGPDFIVNKIVSPLDSCIAIDGFCFVRPNTKFSLGMVASVGKLNFEIEYNSKFDMDELNSFFIARLEKEVGILQARIDSILDSNSWKITAPMRSVVSGLKSVKK